MLGLACLTVIACGGKTAEEHFQSAADYAKEGNQQAAIVELKNAIQQEPRNALARYRLGKLYLDTYDYVGAEKELTRALELGQPSNQIIPLLSLAYERTGADLALLELYADDVTLSTSDRLEVGFRTALSMLRLGKEEDARTLLSEMNSLESASVYSLLVYALSAFIANDIDQALALAIQAREKSPLNRDVLNLLALVYVNKQMQSDAIDVLRDLIRIAPDDIAARFIIAKMMVQDGQMSEAEMIVDQLLAISDQNAELNQLKAITQSAQDDHESALRFSNVSIQNGQNDPTIRLVAGFAAYQLGEFRKAVEHLAFIADMLPNDHPALRILAASQLQLNMDEKASDVLSRIDNLTAQDALLFSKAGLELLRASDTNAAKDVISRVERISESADDLMRIGILKLSLNDVEGILDLEAALAKGPSSTATKLSLASAYIATGQLDKAASIAKKLLSQGGDAAVEGYIVEADIAINQKQYARAEQVLSTAIVTVPGEEKLLAAVLRLMMLQDKFDAALEAADSLLDINPANVLGLSSKFAIERLNGDGERAEQAIYRQLEINKDDIALRLLAARIAFSKQAPEQALEVLTPIQPTRITPEQYWVLMGNALIQTNSLNRASDHYDTWAELFPHQELAAIGQIAVNGLKRDYKTALRIAEDFLKRENNLQLSFTRAYLLTKTGKLAEAKKAYSQIGDEFKQIPFLRGVNARISVHDNRPQDAIEDAKAAYNAMKNIDNLVLLLSVYIRTEQNGLIIPLLEEHLDAVGEDPRVLMLLAEQKLTVDKSKTIEIYEKILTKNINNVVAMNNLAYLLMEEGDLERAELLAKKALELDAENPAIVDTYAQILIKKGDLQAAVRKYKKMINHDVKNESIRLNYIETLLLNSEVAFARRQIERSTFDLDSSIARLEELKTRHSL